MFSDASCLVFDLDGTISDPQIGIARCLNHALRTHGYPEVPAHWVAGQIGPPLDETFRKLLPQGSEALIDRLVTTYRERYTEVGYAENTAYPGIGEQIRGLHSRGIRLAVCTSKREDFARRILSLFDLLAYFDFVDGGEIRVRKADQLAALLREGHIDTGAVMIGDRQIDVLAARENGLRSIGVLWGFGSEQELSSAGPTLLLERVEQLAGVV